MSADVLAQHPSALRVGGLRRHRGILASASQTDPEWAGDVVGDDGGVRLDLADQWDGVASGELTGPDGQRYRRRTTKAKRREGDQLIQAGTPLALYYWAGGQLEWFDGDEATARWQKVRRAVTSQEPRPQRRRGLDRRPLGGQ